MAETTALYASSSSSSPPSAPICRDISLFTSSLLPIHRTTFLRSSSPPRPRPLRLAIPPKSGSGSGNLFNNSSNDDDDQFSYGSFPWEDPHSPDNSNSGIQWVPEERITLFTADGLVQLGGSLIPRRISPSEKQQGKLKTSQRYLRFQESDYMDPKQSLCLGALFDIAATNGLDMGRRLCIIGFCRSIDMLSDVVEDTVLEHGGEVVAAEKATTSGLHEKLSMTVAVPLLWGVPPASETLHLAVRSGGGIVEKVFWQWHFL